MKFTVVLFSLFCAVSVAAAEYVQTISGAAPSDVTVRCEKKSDWKITAVKTKVENGVGEIEISISNDVPKIPPKFTVECVLPQRDISYLWRTRESHVQMTVDWMPPINSKLSSQMPLYTYISESGNNRMTISTDEMKRDIFFHGGVREEGSILPLKLEFFSKEAVPLKEYRTKVRFDWRDIRYEDAIKDATKWMVGNASLKLANVPECAYLPVYSSWYSFHQNVFAEEIEKECEIASKYGMKVLIVDDGWQTDDTNRGYRYCGDWQVSKRRFPDMSSHVKKVQALGIKYMLWYSVPFVGKKSKNYERFKGKYLNDLEPAGAMVLDPRFPEVREFLVSTYEKALKEWDIDGFKLDFIDSFSGPGEKNIGNGRDTDSVPEAVDKLMKEVYSRLSAIKKDILIEFRQSYIGPAIRQYGNMLRVGDCPGNYWANRNGIARLRLTSGNTAVHADMLEWNASEKVEDAARNVINCLFGVIQYSVMLRDLPQDHLEMIKAWLDFTQKHKGSLVKGGFRAHMPQLGYPILEGYDEKERIFTVHGEDICVTPPADNRNIYIINATHKESILVDVPSNVKCIEIYDTFGVKKETRKPLSGLNRLPCPKSGYIFLSR